MDILSPVSSTSRLALVRFPDHKEPISINKPFLGFPTFKPSAAKRCKPFVHAKLKGEYLACITSSVGVNPLPVLRSPPSPVGSPLFWIGVGVGLSVSALYSWAAARLKMYAKQQALKTLAGQMNTENYHNTLQKLFSIADAVISSNNKSATIDIKYDSEPRVCSTEDVSPEETNSQESAYGESSEDAVVDGDHISPSDYAKGNPPSDYAKGNPPRVAVEALEKVLGSPAVQTLAMDVVNKLFTAL